MKKYKNSYNGLSKIQYKYGDCISICDIVYKRLKIKGYNPRIIEGYAEVNNVNDILPDGYFLKRYNKKEYKKLKDINYNDYPKILQHTWIECNNHIIDITRSQFDVYGGIINYIKV